MKRWFNTFFRWFKPVRFSSRAQQALVFAFKEADRLNHNYISTEHILLGLVKIEEGVASNVLQRMGVSGDNVRLETERFIGRGTASSIVGRFAYTPRAKRVFGLSFKEARILGNSQIETEHILLALLREDNGVAARILKKLGMTLEQTRLEVLQELDPNISQ